MTIEHWSVHHCMELSKMIMFIGFQGTYLTWMLIIFEIGLHRFPFNLIIFAEVRAYNAEDWFPSHATSDGTGALPTKLGRRVARSGRNALVTSRRTWSRWNPHEVGTATRFATAPPEFCHAISILSCGNMWRRKRMAGEVGQWAHHSAPWQATSRPGPNDSG